MSTQRATFYHAGCPVCVGAEQAILDLVDRDQLEIVNVVEDTTRLKEAEQKGVNSVPALVMSEGSVLHINHGADLADLKG